MATDDPIQSAVGVTRVEFSLTSPEYPFVGVTVQADCRLILKDTVPRGDDICTKYFRVVDADPRRILTLLGEREGVGTRLLTDGGSSELIEVTASGDCPFQFLAERGVLPTDGYSTDGAGRISADIPEDGEPARIVETFLETHQDATLVSKKCIAAVGSSFSERPTLSPETDSLTRRQREVVVAARDAGYYDWPRETNGRELAERLGISPPTLHKHLRAAERKLVSSFVERTRPDPDLDPSAR